MSRRHKKSDRVVNTTHAREGGCYITTSSGHNTAGSAGPVCSIVYIYHHVHLRGENATGRVHGFAIAKSNY